MSHVLPYECPVSRLSLSYVCLVPCLSCPTFVPVLRLSCPTFVLSDVCLSHVCPCTSHLYQIRETRFVKKLYQIGEHISSRMRDLLIRFAPKQWQLFLFEWVALLSSTNENILNPSLFLNWTGHWVKLTFGLSGWFMNLYHVNWFNGLYHVVPCSLVQWFTWPMLYY